MPAHRSACEPGQRLVVAGGVRRDPRRRVDRQRHELHPLPNRQLAAGKLGRHNQLHGRRQLLDLQPFDGIAFQSFLPRQAVGKAED